jgi:putative spermidine/putrescine transport system substrate-binding protein
MRYSRARVNNAEASMRRFFLMLPLLLAAAPADARDFTVGETPGAYADAKSEAYYGPYRRFTGRKLEVRNWDGGAASLGDYDLVELGPVEEADLCASGGLAKADWSRIGDPERYFPGAAAECGVGAALHAYVIAHARGVVPDAVLETGWAGFFDPAKASGRRILPRSARGVLEAALLGDGAAPEDIYPLLATEEGRDRAFDTLARLNSSVAFYGDEEEGISLLGERGAAMAFLENGAVVAANARHGTVYRIAWPGNVHFWSYWAIPAGAPNAADALGFLGFAAQPERQRAGRLPAMSRKGWISIPISGPRTAGTSRRVTRPGRPRLPTPSLRPLRRPPKNSRRRRRSQRRRRPYPRRPGTRVSRMARRKS